MPESPDSVRDSALLLHGEKPLKSRAANTGAGREKEDGAVDDDCRTDATTVRASNVHNAAMNDQEDLARRVARDLLALCPNSGDRAVLLSYLQESFQGASDREIQFRRQLLVYDIQISQELMNNLLQIPIGNSWDAFLRQADYIHRQNTVDACSVTAPDSSLSENAGSGSARMQGTPLGSVGHGDAGDNNNDSATDGAQALPQLDHRARRVTSPTGNAQDADDNSTLRRNQGCAQLGSAAAAAATTQQPTNTGMLTPTPQPASHQPEPAIIQQPAATGMSSTPTQQQPAVRDEPDDEMNETRCCAIL